MTEGGSASLWSVWSWVTELLLFGVVPLVILVMVIVVSAAGHPRGHPGWSSSWWTVWSARLVILVLVSVVSAAGHPRGQRGWSSSCWPVWSPWLVILVLNVLVIAETRRLSAEERRQHVSIQMTSPRPLTSRHQRHGSNNTTCLLYTSDAADE